MPEDASKMGVPPHWMGDIQVADVDATCTLAKSLGGKIFHEPSDIPTVGRFAVIADPQGAVFAIFKPNAAMQAHEPKEGEFCWNELLSTDDKAGFDFYAKLFGWKVDKEMDMGAMGTYRTFGLGGDHFGGVMKAPKGMPSMWMHYTETSDLDAAIGRATKQGAKVMNGPMEVPGGGKIAQLMDPQGAAFALHQAPLKS